MAALPLPVQPESLPVPGDHSFGLDDRQSESPAAPKTREPDPQQSIRAPQTEAMNTSGSLENQELMPQGKNLSVQRCADSKSLPNRRKERENDREHGLSKLSRRPFKFNWVNENRVFGRHRSAGIDMRQMVSAPRQHNSVNSLKRSGEKP
jgi:hypothetical protein